MVACNTPDGYSDIVFICGEFKSTKPFSDKELPSQAFSFHLENRTRELEKELSITKEALEIEREEQLEEENRKLKELTPQELFDKLTANEKEISELKVQLS
nr:1740_t:CDS:2 [Entrophospora candida]